MSDADVQVLPGFNRADLTWLAECMEGRHGDARVVESASLAAAFIRAALAVSDQPASGVVTTLSAEEHREIVKQRAHAARNQGDPE
jgi:hypothetical protein